MAFQKKTEDFGYREFKKALSENNLGNLYIFHGEETYLRDFYLGKMKESLLSGGLDDFNYHALPAKDFSMQRLHEAVDAMPMMSERTFVVVYDYDLDKGAKEELIVLATAAAPNDLRNKRLLISIAFALIEFPLSLLLVSCPSSPFRTMRTKGKYFQYIFEFSIKSKPNC